MKRWIYGCAVAICAGGMAGAAAVRSAATAAPAARMSAPATAPAAARNAKVVIDNFKFQPKELTVARGTTVTWINQDDAPHTATSRNDPPKFDSRALDTGERFSFTFTGAGTYRYYCKVHTHMSGVVIVK